MLLPPSSSLPARSGGRGTRRAPVFAVGLALGAALALAGIAGCGGGAGQGPDAEAPPASAPDRGLAVLDDSPAQPLDPRLEDAPRRANFHDFGRVPVGDVLAHPFRMRNVEDEPITVTRVTPSCGCTVPSLRCVLPDGEVIEGKSVLPGMRDLITVPPGAILELHVAIDTKHVKLRNVDQLLSITLQTDHEASYFRQFEVHILVESPFEAVPKEIQLGNFAGSAGGSGRVEVVQTPGFAHRVTGLGELPPGVETSLAEEDRFGRAVWILEAGFTPPVELGLHAVKLALETEREDGTPGPEILVPLTGTAVPDVQSDPSRLVLVVSRNGGDPPAPAAVELHSLLPGHLLAVTAAAVEPRHADRLALTAEPIRPDDAGRAPRWRLRLELAGDPPDEFLSGIAVVRLDDPQTPVIEVPYVVHVR